MSLNQDFIREASALLGQEQFFVSEPMSKHTTFNIGGPADYLLFPANMEQLSQIFVLLKNYDIPHTILGNGSNVLVLDKGIRGAVIKMHAPMSYKRCEGNRIIAGAGAYLKHVSQFAAENGLTGMEFACGIPGSLGGAVFMNAGAQGQYIASAVKYVDVFECGKRLRIPTKECDFSYKCSRFMKRNSIVLGVCLHLKGMETQKIESSLDRVKAARNRLPKGRSMGCVFKNPSSIPAGALIEQAGLKGISHGDAIISDEHANFIITRGNATAEDVRYLIDLAKEQVYKRTGVLLEEEIRYIGDF